MNFNTSPNSNTTNYALADVLTGNFSTYSEAANDPTGFLANCGMVTIAGARHASPLQTNVENGLMLAGDTNNDNLVSVRDHNLLKGTFGRMLSQTGYDGRGDFTGDQRVDINDFNLLKLNFSMAGAGPNCP